jgi:hypothetical protein
MKNKDNLINIKNDLRKYAFVNSGNHFTKDIIQDLKSLCEEMFSSKKYSLYNDTMRKLPFLKTRNNKLLLNLINEIKFFLQEVYENKLYLNKVLFQNKKFYDELKNNSLQKLPYIQHIDKNRFLKALIYLDEVTIDHGPIHFSLTRNENYEEKRQGIIKKKLGISNITKEVTVFRPITGQAGDVIIFDTNCPHYAGVGNMKFSRKSIRLDFEPLNWNNFYFLNKLRIRAKNFLI